jgi:hypothetical protein
MNPKIKYQSMFGSGDAAGERERRRTAIAVRVQLPAVAAGRKYFKSVTVR